MSNFIKVDVSSLSSYQNDFNNEHNYFNNKTYTTFTSGYLKSCGDQYINQMASHLKSYYERVEIGYRNINTWWTGYVNDVEALEKLLSGEGNAAGIEEPAVISAVAKLFNIDTYENTLDGTFGEQGGDYGSAFSFDDQSAIDMANANVFGKNDASTSQNFNILNATGATVLTAVGGAAEGFLSKGENVVDAALVAGTATLTSSAPVALIDLIQKGYSKISGKEVELLSDKIWDSTKAFVAKDHVKTMFNDFYENNSYGQWIKNNAIGFDVVRNFSAGLGGIAFNFTVSALTGGTIPPSAVAAVTDFGAGTAQAWAEGASTEAGMVYGIGHAAIGYITYASGEKTKIIKNPFARAGVDGSINTAGEGIDEILKIATYKKGYTNKEGEYVEFTDDDNIFDRVGRVYEESGGFKNVVTQFALGAARSYVGEKITDGVGKFTNKVGRWLKKFRSKNSKPDIEVLDAKPAIDDSKPELPPNQTIIDTEGKSVGFDYETLDGDKIDDFPSGIGTFDDNIKGLPAGADDVGLTTKNPKSLTSAATEGLPSTTALNAFDDVEMPTQNPSGTNSGVEVLNMEDVKPLAASSDALGDTSALKAFDEVEMPKVKTQGLSSGIDSLEIGESKPLTTASDKLGLEESKVISSLNESLEERSALSVLEDAKISKQKTQLETLDIGDKIDDTIPPISKLVDTIPPTSSLDDTLSPFDKTPAPLSNPVEITPTKPKNIQPLEFSQNANPKNMPEIISNKPVLYTPSVDSNSKDFTGTVFRETKDTCYGLGNDQGHLSDFQYFTDEAGNYIPLGSQEYLDAIKTDKKIELKYIGDDIKSVYSVLQHKYGMSYEDAVRTCELINVDSGVCTYASTLDNLTMLFINHQQEFYDRTGVPLFVEGYSESGARMNTGELMADIYVTANLDSNGGKYFTTTPDGRVTFTKEITIDQFGNAYRDGESETIKLNRYDENSAINIYLRNNGLKEIREGSMWESIDILTKKSQSQKERLRILKQIGEDVQQGKQLKLGIFSNDKGEIRFFEPNTSELYTSTKIWGEGGGHALKIIGTNSTGLEISSWGQGLVIPYEDLLDSESDWYITNISLKQEKTKPKFSWKNLFSKKDAESLTKSQSMAKIATPTDDASILHAIGLNMEQAKGSVGDIETLNLGETKPTGIQPIIFSQQANPKNMIVTKYVEPVLYTPSIDPKSNDYTRKIFEETTDSVYGIGNDQGILANMQYYTDSSGKHIYPGGKEYLNAIKSGQKLKIHQNSFDMASVYNLLTTKHNMSFEDAVRTAQLIDVDDGVCSYAATLDNLTMLFVDRQQEFYDKTGIPLFIKGDSASGARINAPELLTDLYVTVNNVKNGGNYFTLMPDGSTTFTKDITIDRFGNAFRDGDSKQVYLSNGHDGVNISVINKYLEKNGFTERIGKFVLKSKNTPQAKAEALSKIITDVQNGKQITMGLHVNKDSKYEIRFFEKNGSLYETTKTWKEGGGHAVKIIGSTGNGVVVSTWGKELLIPFDDIIKTDASFTYSQLFIRDNKRLSWGNLFGKKDLINFKQSQTMATIGVPTDDASILHAIGVDMSLARGSDLVDNIETLNFKESDSMPSLGVDRLAKTSLSASNNVEMPMPYESRLRGSAISQIRNQTIRDVDNFLSNGININNNNYQQYFDAYNKLVDVKNSAEIKSRYMNRQFYDPELGKLDADMLILEHYIRRFGSGVESFGEETFKYRNLTLQVNKYKFNGVDFYEQANIDQSKMSFQKILEAYNKVRQLVGDEQMKKLKRVLITDVRNPDDDYWSRVHGYDFPSAATGGDGEINIWKYANKDSLDETFAHESGHVIDVDRKISNSKKWRLAVKNDGNFASSYAEEAFNKRKVNKCAEDFAESLANLYKIGTVEFQRKYPHRFEILKQILSETSNTQSNSNFINIIKKLFE